MALPISTVVLSKHSAAVNVPRFVERFHKAGRTGHVRCFDRNQ